MERDKVELVVVGVKNKEISVLLTPKSAEYINRLREDGQNVDNFTKKCHQYALEQSFSDENFRSLLEWWIYNLDINNPNSVVRYLNDLETMDADDPWRIRKVGYSGYHEPFRNITER